MSNYIFLTDVATQNQTSSSLLPRICAHSEQTCLLCVSNYVKLNFQLIGLAINCKTCKDKSPGASYCDEDDMEYIACEDVEYIGKVDGCFLSRSGDLFSGKCYNSEAYGEKCDDYGWGDVSSIYKIQWCISIFMYFQYKAFYCYCKGDKCTDDFCNSDNCKKPTYGK